MSNQDHVTDPVEDAINSIKAGLQDGGPPVDSALIMAFIDNGLPSEAMPKVRLLIDTWRAWNENYRSLRFAVASARDVDEWLSTSQVDREIPFEDAKSKSPEYLKSTNQHPEISSAI